MKQITNVADALQLVHDGLQAKDQQSKDDAETLLSALVFQLRHKQAILPDGAGDPYRRLARRYGRV
jgi:hypothetical protein